MNHEAYDINSEDGWVARWLNGHIVGMIPSEQICPEGCLYVVEEKPVKDNNKYKIEKELGKIMGSVENLEK